MDSTSWAYGRTVTFHEIIMFVDVRTYHFCNEIIIMGTSLWPNIAVVLLIAAPYDTTAGTKVGPNTAFVNLIVARYDTTGTNTRQNALNGSCIEYAHMLTRALIRFSYCSTWCILPPIVPSDNKLNINNILPYCQSIDAQFQALQQQRHIWARQLHKFSSIGAATVSLQGKPKLNVRHEQTIYAANSQI